MIKRTSRGCTYFQFESFPTGGVVHGIFTRLGGVSKPPWNSLNLGGTVGDDPAAVAENLSRLVSSLGYSAEDLAQIRQIHSAHVFRVEHPTDAEHQGDGMITNCSGLLLLMRFADCVPLLFYDPKKRAAAIAHAGWQGTLKDVAGETVRNMQKDFGTDPGDLLVGIGPSIGPDHYYIGEDVIRRVRKIYPDCLDEVLIKSKDGVKLDLWKANQINLQRADISNLETGAICTGCNLEHWYSHRAEHGTTGRFAAVIGLVEAGKDGS